MAASKLNKDEKKQKNYNYYGAYMRTFDFCKSTIKFK